MITEAPTAVPTTGDVLVVATDPVKPTTFHTTSAPSVTQTPQSSQAPTSQTSSGDGGGGLTMATKAGIIMGTLGGILVIFVLVWLIYSARKKVVERRRRQLEDDEKINGPFSDSAAIRTPATAPRLSLRPVTQFLPSFNTTSHTETTASRGIALTLNPVASPSPTTSLSPLARPTGASAWERPTIDSIQSAPDAYRHKRTGTNASQHPNNPFNDSQRVQDEPVSPISSVGSLEQRNRLAVGTGADAVSALSEPVSPIDDSDNEKDNRIGVAKTTPGNGAVPSSVGRRTSMRKDLPKPLDLTKAAAAASSSSSSQLYAAQPPSPAGTEYSMQSIAPGQTPVPTAGAAAIAAAGGPQHSTVHRVQLDFKPTLEDEMELKAGQLVRLLHEYDDGWALVIRLDRSEQGVVPRTCLSTRPVKPRTNPNNNPGASLRGGPPVNPSYGHRHQNSFSRPRSPHSPGLPIQSNTSRPSSPAGGYGGRGGYGYGQGAPPGQAY